MKRDWGARRAQSMVEFALGLPLLLLILFGFAEVGIAVMKYNIVANVARDGARFASTLTGIDATTWTQNCNVGAIGTPPYPGQTGSGGKSYTVAACSGTTNVVSTVAAKAVGLTPADLQVTIYYTQPMESFNRGKPVTVTVAYTHRFLLAALAGSGKRTFYFIPTTITLQSSAAMNYE